MKKRKKKTKKYVKKRRKFQNNSDSSVSHVMCFQRDRVNKAWRSIFEFNLV